jgi:hypothetical protein
MFFLFFRIFSALAIVAARLAANEFGYAGDTPAATVAWIIDPPTTPTCNLCKAFNI